MTFRTYSETDYDALCAFLIELNRDGRTHINWNWARFEWMYEHPEFDRSAEDRIGLWLEGDRIVGAAIYDMYVGEAFCAALPEYAALTPAILDYACRALRDGSGLAVAICGGSAIELAAAEAAGFEPVEQSETVMKRELDGLDRAAPPEGFTIRELDPGEDLEKFRWLLWRGFDHGCDRAEFENTEERATRRRRHFDVRLSLAAVDPAGDYAAYVCLWYAGGTDYAYVEPVCTVPAHRGKGLAGALLSEALARAKALGAERAYVISDLAFYEKLGFETDRRFTFYRKA